MLAESARLFTSSPRESLIGSPPPPPTPVDSSLCGSRGVRLSSEAPAANAGAAAFPATVKCARQAPSVNRFHHPRPFTTLVGSPLSRNPFQISGLPPTASHLTESLRSGRGARHESGTGRNPISTACVTMRMRRVFEPRCRAAVRSGCRNEGRIV